MTISAKLTPKRAKSAALNLTVLIDKAKIFSGTQNHAINQKDTETEEAGFNILKKFLDFAFQEEYDLIISIISDLFGVSAVEAEDIPLEDIFDFVTKDKVVRTFFPRLAVLEARAQSDILPKPGN